MTTKDTSLDNPVRRDGRTHWADCYLEHQDCAVRQIASLKAEIARLNHKLQLYRAYLSSAEGRDVIAHIRTYAMAEAAKVCDEFAEAYSFYDPYPEAYTYSPAETKAAMAFAQGRFKVCADKLRAMGEERD